MRRGYRRATKRYRKYPSWKVCQTFINLSDAIEGCVKHYDYEGQEFKLLVNLQTEETRVIEEK
jgi:hypothetical protein